MNESFIDYEKYIYEQKMNNVVVPQSKISQFD